jgi:hypothetical protein
MSEGIYVSSGCSYNSLIKYLVSHFCGVVFPLGDSSLYTSLKIAIHLSVDAVSVYRLD